MNHLRSQSCPKWDLMRPRHLTPQPEIPLPLPSILQPEKNSGKRKDGRKEEKKLRKEGRKRGREREGRRKGEGGEGKKERDRETEKGDQIPLYFSDISLHFSANQDGMNIVLH